MLNDFLKFMASNGSPPKNPSDIKVTGGAWVRYQLADDKSAKSSSGTYRLSQDGDFFYGCVCNHKLGETFNYSCKPKKKLTDVERAAWQERAEKQKREFEQERGRAESRAVAEAAKLFRSASQALDNHPYLIKKGIKAWNGLLQDGEDLIIPIWRGDSRKSFQRIMPDGSKRFQSDGQIKGGYFPLVDPADEMSIFIIGEGYATCATIKHQVKYPVICAFNAGNLREVAEYIRKKYTNATIVLAADNDQWRLDQKLANKNGYTAPPLDDVDSWQLLEAENMLDNIGVRLATEAAAAVGGHVAIPPIPFVPIKAATDFNDLGGDKTKEFFDEFLASLRTALIINKKRAETLQEQKKKDIRPAHKVDWMRSIIWKDEMAGKKDTSKARHNALLMLKHGDAYSHCFAYNEFAKRAEVIFPLPWESQAESEKYKVRAIKQDDISILVTRFEADNMPLRASDMSTYVTLAAKNRTYHPIRDRFSGLAWDGQPRVAKFFQTYCGSTKQPDEYLARVAQCFLLASVKRIFKPGTPFHHMLILEGEQGLRKSTLLRELATIDDIPYFYDGASFKEIGSREMVEKCQGCFFIEFQEMEGMSPANFERIKGWIVADTDVVQRKYENEKTEFPRQFCIAGSTNREQYLFDVSGARRFWPVLIESRIDIEALSRDKMQIWAEVMEMYNRGEKHYVDMDDPAYDLFEQQQGNRQHLDVWYTEIQKYVENIDFIEMDVIAVQALNISRSFWDSKMQQRIKNIMTQLGYEFGAHYVGGGIKKKKHCFKYTGKRKLKI